MLEPYLQDVANSANRASAAQHVFAQVSEYMRQNIISVLIGYNPGTVLKHGTTALGNSMQQVGPLNLLKAYQSLFSINDKVGETNWRFAMDTSEELSRRQRHYMETFRGSQENVLRNNTLRENMIAGGAWVVSKADLASAVPTWLAQYEKTMTETGSHGDAIFMADRAVRQAHGSSVITNRAGVSRGGAMAQWMSSLYGFFSHILNKQYELMWQSAETLKLAKEGEFAEASKKLPELTSKLFFYVILPAMVEEMATPYTNEQRHSWGQMAAVGLAHSLAASWIGVRDIAHAMLSGHDPSVGLISTGYKTVADVVRDLKKDRPLNKEHAGNLIQHGVTVFGAATGLTNAQEGKSARFIYDYTTGKQRPKKFGDWMRGIRHGQMDRSSPVEDLFYGGGKRR